MGAAGMASAYDENWCASVASFGGIDPGLQALYSYSVGMFALSGVATSNAYNLHLQTPLRVHL